MFAGKRRSTGREGAGDDDNDNEDEDETTIIMAVVVVIVVLVDVTVCKEEGRKGKQQGGAVLSVGRVNAIQDNIPKTHSHVHNRY
jgi:hypothetical protein